MKKGMINAAIKNRKITIFTIIVIAISGLFSYYITPKQEVPDINAPVAIVTTIYPGASPEDVEKLVTAKIENEVANLNGYDYSFSYSYNSISIVCVRLDYGTDVKSAWSDLRKQMEDIQDKLPKECYKIDINTNVVETAGIIVSLSGDNYSYEKLTSYAENLKKELSKIEGISRFDIDGEQDKEITIEMNIDKLNFYKLSLNDIVNIIKSQNIEIPSGTIDDGKSKINVKSTGTFTSIDEISDVVIAVSDTDGTLVRLSDIADIRYSLKKSNYKVKHKNKNAILLTGYFKADRNILIIGKDVEKRLDELKKQLPNDINVENVLFQPDDVRKSVNDFIMNLIEGIVFVVIVVFIGMGFRNAVIVSTAIPISILSTIICMNLLGIKIHQISISSLIVALGMLVDNAIVVSDAIQNRIDNDEEKISACVNGVKEVAIPILTSTLTTIGAFTPLLLLSSIAGEYMSSLPKIIIIALTSSYLVAIFITPTMAYIFFKKSKNRDKKSKTRRFFDFMLSQGLKKKKIVMFFIIIVVGATSLIFGRLGLQFFPKADKDVIYIDIRTEQNIDLYNTEELVSKVSEILDNQPEIISYTAAIGSSLPKFYNTVLHTAKSPDVAQIIVKLDLEKSDRFMKNSEITDHLQEIFNSELIGGTATVKQLEIGEPIGSPIRVRITGNSFERLGEVSKEIQNYLEDIDGTLNVENDFSDKIYEYSIDVDSDMASYYGISKYDIQNEMSIALRGRKASVFRENGKERDIIVKGNISSKEELENLAIKSSYTNNKIVLKAISDTVLRAQIPVIKKYDRDFAVMVTCDVKSGYSPTDIQNELNNKLDNIDMTGVKTIFDGEKEKIAENFGSVGNSAIFAVLLIYVILLIQFKSFVQPLIILLTIPLSGIGSIFGLYLFKQPLSFTALLGMVSLMGIVVNNAIVLLDYINNARNNRKSIDEACLEATNKRFRPIILSTTTTVIGLTPLAFSGSEIFRPMAISLMSGLLVSTLLTLVIIPIVYSIVESQFEKHRVRYNKNI